MVGFSAGGATDIVARVLAGSLSQKLGQQVFVENRTGAGGTMATQEVAGAEPDGTTLLMTPFANAVNETLFKRFSLQIRRLFHRRRAGCADRQRARRASVAERAAASPSSLRLAKSRPPGDILAASSGVGTATHLANELFNMTAGHQADLGAVPRRRRRREGSGVRSIEDHVRRHSDRCCHSSKTARCGALRRQGCKRDRLLPDLPTVAEFGLPGFDVLLWLGLLAPKATPRPVIERLAAATSSALSTPDVKSAFAAQGFDALSGTPDDFAAFYRSEVDEMA